MERLAQRGPQRIGDKLKRGTRNRLDLRTPSEVDGVWQSVLYFKIGITGQPRPPPDKLASGVSHISFLCVRPLSQSPPFPGAVPMRLSTARRTAVLAIAAVGLLGSSACFGSFNLTRKVWTFNKNVSPDKFVQELVFLAFAAIPVYSIAAGLDALIINSIEFWTGENPVQIAKRTTTDDGRLLVQRTAVTESERVMVIEELKDEEIVSTTTVRMPNDGESLTVETRQADGQTDLRTVSRLDDGTVLVER